MEDHGYLNLIRNIFSLFKINIDHPRLVIGLLLNFQNKDNHSDLNKLLNCFKNTRYSIIEHNVDFVHAVSFDIKDFANVLIKGKKQIKKTRCMETQTEEMFFDTQCEEIDKLDEARCDEVDELSEAQWEDIDKLIASNTDPS